MADKIVYDENIDLEPVVSPGSAPDEIEAEEEGYGSWQPDSEEEELGEGSSGEGLVSNQESRREQSEEQDSFETPEAWGKPEQIEDLSEDGTHKHHDDPKKDHNKEGEDLLLAESPHTFPKKIISN
ncbi:unnamed protein product [Lota lota]